MEYVLGNLNSADCSTRGCPANRFNNCSWIDAPFFLNKEFIPNFEVLTTSFAAYPNSLFQAEDVPSSDKTCLKESEVEKEEKGEEENRQSANTIPRVVILQPFKQI